MDLPPFDILSIASGGGGLDRAVELAAPGSRVVCHIEREAFAASVLVDAMAKGFVAPSPVWSDARTFDGRRFRGRLRSAKHDDFGYGKTRLGAQK